MNSTYAQKSSPVQKAADTKAASVLDSSAQGESLQRKADMVNNAAQRAEAPRPNNTGMPDNLKAGIESLSGFSMDNVRVHYNSSKPATVQALAYTQGTDIHVAPGQEKCLPHEAWHVAQQMAGRVSPTTNINGMPVNDNTALEHEADVMGEKAVQCKTEYGKNISQKNCCILKKQSQLKSVVQCVGDKISIEKNDLIDSNRVERLPRIQSDLINVCYSYFDEQKRSRAESRRAFQENLRNLESRTNVVLYERGQIDGMLKVEKLKEKLNTEIKNLKLGDYVFIDDSNQNQIRVVYSDVMCVKVLFWIWVADARFTPQKNRENGSVETYRRKGGVGESDSREKEYVKTSNGCFVPRFVYRNLNSYDKKRLNISDVRGSKGKKEKKVEGINRDYSVLCGVDPRNPLFLTENCKNLNLENYNFKLKEDRGARPTYYYLSSIRNRKKLLSHDLKDYSLYERVNRYWYYLIDKDDVKLKCAASCMLTSSNDIQLNLSCFDKQKRKVLVAVDRISKNIRDDRRPSLYNFFNLGEMDTVQGKSFWTIYNESLKEACINQAILEHLRSKEKQGGSGFVSCTATKHPIMGSSGKDFYQGKDGDSINAVAKIDLTKIGPVKVYSTYSKGAMASLFGKEVPEYDGDGNPKEYGDVVENDKNAAARDAMRTREIVISGPIPRDAIVEIYYNNIGTEGTYEEYGQDETKRKCWSNS